MLERTPISPCMIGIAGGTASGKTSVCNKIIEDLGQATVAAEKRRVVCIVQDNFYRQLTTEENEKAKNGGFNFDHPSAIDFDLLKSILDDILHCRIAKVPKYNFVTNSRENEYDTIYPGCDVVIVEGILAFYDPEIRSLFELKIFVEADSDTRLCRRVNRDVEERGRSLETVLTQYMDSVKPAFEDFCLPTKKYADLIVPNSEDNRAIVAIDLLVHHAKELLATRNRDNPREVVQNGLSNGHGRSYGGLH